MDSKQRSELIRLEARLGAFEDIKAEIEPWIMEERDLSGREALDNVIAHVDAEIVELHHRREEMRRELRLKVINERFILSMPTVRKGRSLANNCHWYQLTLIDRNRAKSELVSDVLQF